MDSTRDRRPVRRRDRSLRHHGHRQRGRFRRQKRGRNPKPDDNPDHHATTVAESPRSTSDTSDTDPDNDPDNDADSTTSSTDNNGQDSQELGDGLTEALDDVVECTKVDEETPLIEIIDDEPVTVSYSLTIAFFDQGGAPWATTSCSSATSDPVNTRSRRGHYLRPSRPGRRDSTVGHFHSRHLRRKCSLRDSWRVAQHQSNRFPSGSNCGYTGRP